MDETPDRTLWIPNGPLGGAVLEVCHENGRPWSLEDQKNYVLEKLHDTPLIWCDMAGFLFDETGRPLFADDCGNCYPAPDEADLRVRLIGPLSYSSEAHAQSALVDILLDLLRADGLSRLFDLALDHLRSPETTPWPKDAAWPREPKARFFEAVYGKDGWHRRAGLATDDPLYVRNLQAEAIARLLEGPCTPEAAAELHVVLSWAAFADEAACARRSVAHGKSTPWYFGYDWEHAAEDRWVSLDVAVAPHMEGVD